MEKFWQVWREGGGPATRKHDTLGSAMTEAERLARKHEGARFVVMEAVQACAVNHVQWEIVADPDCPS